MNPGNGEVSDAGPLTSELKPKREPGIRSSDWLGIRRIVNDLLTSKKKMKNRSKIVDSLTISGYGRGVMSEAQ